MREYSRSKPRKISAGSVKITPPATDSPAEPVVWTMLFSRIVARPRARSRLIERTAIGMEAATVRPGAQADVDGDRAEDDPEERSPSMTARAVNSGGFCAVGHVRPEFLRATVVAFLE